MDPIEPTAWAEGTEPGGAVSLRAHAKLNLALAVDRPIPEGPHAGMHPIASWMVPIELADEVRIERVDTEAGDLLSPPPPPTRSIEWADGRPVDWSLDRDLAVRAHRALESEVGRPLPARLTIRKSIPDGGGLGGGSSDAAAVLIGMDRLFTLGLGTERLRTIAATLGSDIPFFIPDPGETRPGSAFVSGLGETIERTSLSPPIPVVLVFPPFGCPTGEVYGAFDECPPPSFGFDRVRMLADGGSVESAALFNDLAEPAFCVRPELRTLHASLEREFGVPFHVSGSGSTLFCLGSPEGAAAPASGGGPGGVGVAQIREFLPSACGVCATSVLSS